MKKIVLAGMIALASVSCKKEKITTQPQPPVTNPVMQYLELGNRAIPFGQHSIVDVDRDGQDDLLFSTMLVGDPIHQLDRRMYFVSSSTQTKLLQNNDNQSPVLNKNDQVMLLHPGYQWLEVTSLLLAEKVVPVQGNSFWRGLWQEANHQYLPIQVHRTNQTFQGWVELSFDKTQERMILHKAALSTEPDKTVRAGI